MSEISPPELSIKALLASSFVAIIIAGVVLLVAVFPAEFGKDPTGLGEKMGLLVLSESHKALKPQVEQPIIVQLSTTPEVSEKSVKTTTAPVIVPSVPSSDKPGRYRENDSVTLVIPAGQGLEYKFHLLKNETLQYRWKTDGNTLYFDFHGEPQGDKTGYFKSFIVKTDTFSKGTFSAPFEGSHGWYWENNHAYPIKVKLVTSGHYDIIGKIEPH